VRTEASAGKVKRIRANSRVLLAPATARGKPAGALAAGTARVLAAADSEPAEQALKANYGLGRRLYEDVLGSARGVEAVYLEVRPGEASLGAGGGAGAGAADPGAAESGGRGPGEAPAG
jgi:hypothetical protein